MRISSFLIPALALATTFVARPASAWHGPDVTFHDCTEVVGLDLIPAANARPMVPEAFDLSPADEAGELAIIIVRVVECGAITVAGHRPRPGKLMHVGINVANGDDTADINNYQLWFATDHRPLRNALRASGLAADFDDLTFDYTPNGDGTGAIDIMASPPHAPGFDGTGTGFLLDIPRGPFIATWWAEGRRGLVQMRTAYDDVLFGVSDTVVTTPADSDLAALAGTTSLPFVVLNTYNDVPYGEMEITGERRPRRCR